MAARFADDARPAWTGDEPRPLACTVWYPVAPATELSESVEGPPGDPLFVIGDVAENAPLADAPESFPVVLMSHGTGGSASGMGWLGVRLARTGYVALALDHHGNTATEPYLAEGFACWWERATDLTVALDRLAGTPPFSGRLDLESVRAAGFSLGAYTVLALAGGVTDMARFLAWCVETSAPRGPREFPDLGDRLDELRETSPRFRESMARHDRSYRDPRVRAVLALAPPPPVRAFTPESLEAIRTPVSIMVGRGDREAPFDACAVWLEARIPGSRLTLLEEAVGHYVFLPEATERGRVELPDICVDPPGVDRRAIHDAAAAEAVAWFAAKGGM